MNSTIGRNALPLSPPTSMQWGDNALTAPTTPQKRIEKVDRSKADPQNVKAAEGMEAMFIDYMMKVMRETVPKSEYSMDSPATEIYQGMLDQEVAQKSAKMGGIGLADQIIAYLESQRYTGSNSMGGQRTASPRSETGGTAHEGKPIK